MASTSQRHRQLDQKRGQLCLLFVAIVASFSLAEIAVRILFRYNTPATVDASSIKYQGSLFSRHLFVGDQAINLDAGWGKKETESPAERIVYINRHGFRGEDFSLRKPAGVLRVVVIGGSAVFDLLATKGTDWPHLAQENLRKKGWPGVEVVNAGVPGHASFDSLGRLYTQIWMLEPDYVVLNNAWNDIKYFTRLNREQPLGAIYKPYDQEDNPFRSYRGPIDRFLCNSQLYVKLRTRFYLWKLGPGDEGSVPGAVSSQDLIELAKTQYEKTIRSFVEIARVFDIEPILMTQATLVDKKNSEADMVRIQYEYQGLDHDALVEAFALCNSTVRKIALDLDVTVVDADASITGRGDLFDDHVHTNAAGSIELARLLSDALTKEFEQRVRSDES